MRLEPVRRRSVADDVFEQLCAGLVHGDIAPGDALPSERTLAEHLGVNRQAVREALQRLAQSGLVAIQQGGATRALDARRGGGLDLLPRLLVRRDGTPDPEALKAVMEMRASLGADAARLCALRARKHLASDLMAVADAMTVAEGDRRALADLALSFWDVVVEGSDNLAYRLAFNSLRAAYEPVSHLLADVLAAELEDVADHRAIAEAVAGGDEAAALAAAHRLLARGTAAIYELLASLAGERPMTRRRRQR